IGFYPQDGAAFFNRANARRESGDLHGAIADYNSAIELNPQYAEAYINRGIAKRATGDEAGASRDFTQANEINQSRYPPEQ
ncbi:MAG: tetratricopeptide repeat protein, partial [Caldilineaceae bacterium]|nr:tetratricopeptide repeat protein [Caldilineaceae bacterium]